MNDNIQVWFLRHGKSRFNYETDKYDDFIQMLSNGYSTPLAKDPEIDFKSLPQQVDLIGYSPIQRAVETANVLCNKLSVKKMKKLELLREVKFDKDIVLEHEFESLKQIRPEILERWYNNRNKAESFNDSMNRVKEIESFISNRKEKTIILVTHGWFLRILEIYFVHGKHTDITLDDILNVKPVPLGHSINTTVARRSNVDSVRGDTLSRQSLVHDEDRQLGNKSYLEPRTSYPNHR